MARGEKREEGWEVEVDLWAGAGSMLEPDTETEAVCKWWLEWDQNLSDHLTSHFLGKRPASDVSPFSLCLPRMHNTNIGRVKGQTIATGSRQWNWLKEPASWVNQRGTPGTEKHRGSGGKQFLKVLGWAVVVWWRDGRGIHQFFLPEG